MRITLWNLTHILVYNVHWHLLHFQHRAMRPYKALIFASSYGLCWRHPLIESLHFTHAIYWRSLMGWCLPALRSPEARHNVVISRTHVLDVLSTSSRPSSPLNRPLFYFPGPPPFPEQCCPQRILSPRLMTFFVSSLELKAFLKTKVSLEYSVQTRSDSTSHSIWEKSLIGTVPGRLWRRGGG